MEMTENVEGSDWLDLNGLHRCFFQNLGDTVLDFLDTAMLNQSRGLREDAMVLGRPQAPTSCPTPSLGETMKNWGRVKKSGADPARNQRPQASSF